MKVLILGGSGMLGHKLWQMLRERAETFVSLRRPLSSYASSGLFDDGRVVAEVDATCLADLRRAFDRAGPEVVVNAVGVIKQRKQASDPIPSIKVNALLPHELAELCRDRGARLVHLSTDCVFSGAKGNYTETDKPDPVDLYGLTKWLGEVSEPNCLTLRTSMIGRELDTRAGLLEWFLAQRGHVARGYQRAIFSGLTTLALAQVIADLIENRTNLEGVWHVSAAPISKYDLLSLVNSIYGLGIRLEPDTDFVCDRSLDSSRFRQQTGFRPAPWPELIQAMHEDPMPYHL